MCESYAFQTSATPRSVREDISPPPLRRIDTYGDPSQGRKNGKESPRQPRRRDRSEVTASGGGAVLNCYRSPALCRPATSQESSRLRISPRHGTYDRYEEIPSERRHSSSRGYVGEANGRAGEAIRVSRSIKPTADVCWRDCTSIPEQGLSSNGLGTTNSISEQGNHAIRDVLPQTTTEDKLVQPKGDSHQDENVLVACNAITGTLRDRTDPNSPGEAGTRLGVASPRAEMTLNFPWQHETFASRLVSVNVQAQQTPVFVLDDITGNEGESCLESIETEIAVRPTASGLSLRPYLEMTRFSREEVASTPSTGTTGSRNKNICRACRKPASNVTPLFRCKRCRKGYHDCCGNPKPRQR